MPSTNCFLGGATAVAQVDNLTVASTIEIGDIFIVTLTPEPNCEGSVAATQSVSVTCTTTVAATTATEIYTALAASTLSLFAAITWTNPSSGVVRGTAKVAGVPFYCAATTTESGGGAADAQTFTRAASTANAGPYDWNTAANWSTGAVPATGDTVYIDGRALNAILYGLDQHGVTLAARFVPRTMRYNIGTQSTALTIGATLDEIGKPPTDGSGATMGQIISLCAYSIQTALTIYGSRSAGYNGLPPINWSGSHASNTVAIKGGIVGIGAFGILASAITIPTVTVTGEGTRCVIGPNVTATALRTERGSDVTFRGAAVTTLSINDADDTVRTEGTGTVGTANIQGHLISDSTGIVTTANVSARGFFDLSNSSAARVVTNCNLSGEDARINADNGVPKSVTWSNGIVLSKGATSDQVNAGTDCTIGVT
jgi:hypothetical protein